MNFPPKYQFDESTFDQTTQTPFYREEIPRDAGSAQLVSRNSHRVYRALLSSSATQSGLPIWDLCCSRAMLGARWLCWWWPYCLVDSMWGFGATVGRAIWSVIDARQLDARAPGGAGSGLVFVDGGIRWESECTRIETVDTLGHGLHCVRRSWSISQIETQSGCYF